MMKRFLLISCFLFVAAQGFSQQYSQYNTGTLYDSFENPAQRSFIPDTSKEYAFNFLIPNFNADFYVTGDVQQSLVSRAFGGRYNNGDIIIGGNKYNHANITGGAYEIMFKVFSSLRGNSEVGIFAQTKVEGRAYFTDESVAIFNGPQAFGTDLYNNIFDDHYYYQIYNSIGLSYREEITKRLAIGFKLGFLMGLDYNKLDIYQSHISFDNQNDAATLSLMGKYYQSKGPGNFDARSLLPTSRSPGVQLSIGTSYTTEDHITIQTNIKDLGFIHWYDKSNVITFNSTQVITGISNPGREDSIFNHAKSLVRGDHRLSSFTSPTNSRLELSATKSYFLDANMDFKYSPTLIAAKELWYNGYAGAIVNRVQYKNKYNLSLTGSYDNMNLFSLGLQFMIKTGNGEFYVGSDRLFQSAALGGAISGYSSYTNGSYTGANLFLGFSLKFGPVIEHPLNASNMPNGERGFLGRLYNRLFKTYW